MRGRGTTELNRRELCAREARIAELERQVEGLRVNFHASKKTNELESEPELEQRQKEEPERKRASAAQCAAAAAVGSSGLQLIFRAAVPISWRPPNCALEISRQQPSGALLSAPPSAPPVAKSRRHAHGLRVGRRYASAGSIV